MNCFAFYKQHDPRHLQNVQSAAALELASGCHLPDDFAAWPLGLADNWNAAAEQEAFDTCKTLGDMARAFLIWRAADLDRQIGAGTVSVVAEDSPTGSRRSIHFLTPRMKRSVTATTKEPAAGSSCAMTKAKRQSSPIK